MKKVTTAASIKRLVNDQDPYGAENWVFFMEDEARVTEEIVEQWVRSENAQEVLLEVRITSPFQQKTNEQLGYYFAELLPKITKGYQYYGNEYDKDKVDDLLMKQFFSDAIYDPILEVWDKIPRSKSRASKDEMSDLIDQCIRFVAEHFPEITIEDPDEYKRRMGMTEQEIENSKTKQ